MSEEAIEQTGESVDAQTQTVSWKDSIPEDLSGYTENKGWKEPIDIVNAYKNLEKLVGTNSNKVAIPEEGDDQAWNDFYNKVGRPESAEKYEFQSPENINIDSNLQDWFKGQAYDAGLSSSQAQKLYNSWNELAVQNQQEAAEQIRIESQNQLEALKREWGQAYNEKTEIARRAAQKFSLDEGMAEKIEDAIGTANLLKLFSNIGEGLVEDKFVEGEGNKNFTMTPSQAKAKIEELKLDKQFMSMYLQGNKDAISRMNNYVKLANPS